MKRGACALALGLATVIIGSSLARAEQAIQAVCELPGPANALDTIRVNLATMKACDKSGCLDLKPADDNLLKYDCVADKTFCTVPMNTAGPFVTEDHFAFNTKTRAFEREQVGNSGDIISVPFRWAYSGRCFEGPIPKDQH
jgi:hypothetical protein